MPSPLALIDDACSANSISCEASILKENVELNTHLALLTSNYGKLVESHAKISSSHEDLLVSHGRLRLAHEAIVSKVTSSGPHVDLALYLLPMLYCHVLVLVIHRLTTMLYLVMNCIPCLVSLTMKLPLPLVLLLILTM